ncbi:MAG TPA: family 43 glycosylhydrolase [Jatrophihabitantaceae bacterium]
MVRWRPSLLIAVGLAVLGLAVPARADHSDGHTAPGTANHGVRPDTADYGPANLASFTDPVTDRSNLASLTDPVTDSSTAAFTNPVTNSFTAAFADPSLIRGADGYWYAYATADSQHAGGPLIPIQMARSADLVHWTYLGAAFNDSNWPSWAQRGAFLWAPDIRYADGHYLLYFAATDTTFSSNTFDTAIGVATAPTPAGPWTDSGGWVVAPQPGSNNDFHNTIDPAEFTDSDGQRYLYYGSYYGGVWATKLSADGLRATGAPTMVGIDNRYEGAYVVKHGGYYWLFASSSNCCAGPTSGYAVYAGRSSSPLGPFVDQRGVPMNTSRVGGTLVVAPNGNKWIGTGHAAITTDLSGQDWLVYHAIDRNNPYIAEPFGANARPMVLGRLDWIGGWPTVDGGAWTSDQPQPAPVTQGVLVDAFERSALGRAWTGDWAIRPGTDGNYVHSTDTSTLLARVRPPTDLRVSADLRAHTGSSGGVVVRYRNAANHATAWLGNGTLSVQITVNGHRRTTSTPLPVDTTSWNELTVTLRGNDLQATATQRGLGDPVATLSATLPPQLATGASGVASRGPNVDADDVRIAALYRPHTQVAPTPKTGRVITTDDFDGTTLDGAWTWLRQDAAAHVDGGQLQWPTEAADLTGTANTAGVLLRAAPSGNYVVETKVHLDLGTDAVRNYEQAGLVAYDGDDQFLRLCTVSIWNTRQVEFGKEIPYAGKTSYGSMVFGTPAPTTWLRLAHTVNAAGEHLFRAGMSVDGRHWVWGGTWTLPAGTTPRIGLVSQGGNNPAVTAGFDYVRIYR